ncbi:MAG: radical SAM protein [Candidatus Omnitrophica bacterium]|nr:radical SAM protein [Candidatus Omnitrophota bacterium]
MSHLNCVKKAILHFEDSLSRCRICPRKCGLDRTKSELGYCRAGLRASVYSYLSHQGEEPPISGERGSGTIFFSRCNMKCVYCQNYRFSQLDEGKEVTTGELAEIMLSLEKRGCHNINLVSPTHYLPQILSALEEALGKGLSIPIVYNTSGYELKESIEALEGVIDIYLPDMRYSDNNMAKKYSDAPDYVDRNRESVLEMYRQVGDLIVDTGGIARKGMIVRLLALPEGVSGTIKTLQFIKENISKKTYLSIMSQYYPTFKAYSYPEISRGIGKEEYANVVDEAHLLGLNDVWVQGTPKDFDQKFFGTNIKPWVAPS